jgi:hypothetical protein
MCASSIIVALSLVFLLKRENAKLDQKEQEQLASGVPGDEAALRFRYIL